MGWVVAISNFVTDWTPDAQSDVRRQTPLTFKWGNAKKTSAVIPTFRLLIDVLEWSQTRLIIYNFSPCCKMTKSRNNCQSIYLYISETCVPTKRNVTTFDLTLIFTYLSFVFIFGMNSWNLLMYKNTFVYYKYNSSQHHWIGDLEIQVRQKLLHYSTSILTLPCIV